MDEQAEWDAVLAEREGTAAPAQPAQEPAPAVEAAPVEPQTPAEPAKPTAEELLASALDRIEKIEGRQRNVEGHIGGLTTQQKLMRETLAAAQAAAASAKDAPTQAQVKVAAANPEQWEALKKDFPEWSAATESLLEARLAAVTPGANAETVAQLVKDGLEQARTTITAEVRKEIVNASLDAVVPGWEDEVKTDAFRRWYDAQTPEVKALGASTKVGDAARMLTLFDQSKKASPTQAILDKRKAVLNNAVAAPRGGKPVLAKTPEQMSPEELWNYEARQREKTRQAHV